MPPMAKKPTKGEVKEESQDGPKAPNQP